MKHKHFFTLTLSILLLWVSVVNAQFTVRTIYFQSTDAPPPTAQVINLILEVQDFYRAEMERHGYGDKTFKVETNAAGDVGIHHIKAKHPAIHYLSDTYNQIIAELPFDFRRQSVIGQNNIHLIIMAGLERIDNTKLGVGFPYSQFHSGGTAIVAGNIAKMWIVAHELGHAFGLSHTGKVGAIMSTRGDDFFLDYEMRWLSNHHAFNETHIKTDVPEQFTDLPIQAIGGGTIRFQVVATSKSGLFQSQLCRKRGTYILGHNIISGNSAVITVDASRGRLENGDDAWFQVMDVNGNYTFHHIPRIFLPDSDNEKTTNKNPNIALPPKSKPKPKPKPEIKEVVGCPDCMPDGVDITDDIDDTDLRIRPVHHLTTQWAVLKQR